MSSEPWDKASRHSWTGQRTNLSFGTKLQGSQPLVLDYVTSTNTQQQGGTAAEYNQKDQNFDIGFPEHFSCSGLVHWTLFPDSLQSPGLKAQQWKGWSWCWMTSMPPLPSTRQVNKFHKITLMPLAEHPCKESLLGLWSLLLINEGLAQKLAGEFICSHLEAK